MISSGRRLNQLLLVLLIAANLMDDCLDDPRISPSLRGALGKVIADLIEEMEA
jgi:hypothetical protein